MVDYWSYAKYGASGVVWFSVDTLREFWFAPPTQLAFAIFGTGVTLLMLIRLVLFAWGFIRPSKLDAYRHSETGSWAVVTGASDGIGRAFADELLKAGFHVLLHGRNPEKLRRVRDELARTCPTQTVEFVVADAARADHPERSVVDKIRHLPGKTTVLVNNVGGSVEPLGLFEEYPEEAVDKEINMNARFPMLLTRALLPMLRENKPAIILNCGSAAGVSGFPYTAAYSSTKAFMHALSSALKAEFVAAGYIDGKKNPPDLDVIGFLIGNVSSRGDEEIKGATISAVRCARGCLARIGTGNALEYANWRQGVLMALLFSLPDVIVRRTTSRIMKERFDNQMRLAKEK